MAESSYDVAIIGAGFSGPILAAKLAEHGVNPRNREPLKVALIEAGPYLKGDPRPGYGHPVRRRRFTNVGGSDPSLHWEDGAAKLVGGSSLHWQASAFLPFPIDYVHWQEETGVDWTPENLREAVEETRQKFNIHPYPEQVNTPGNRLFYQVATRMGYKPQRQEGARRNCIYSGFCGDANMCKYDARSSTLVAYIPDAEKHGVDILADTEVEKILIEAKGNRGTARGLICRNREGTYEMAASHIILACGFQKTPLLLMRSGYGPEEWQGNPILVKNNNIGKHMDGHPRIPGISAIFDDPMGEEEMGSVRGYFMIHDTRSDAMGRLLLRADLGGGMFPEQAALNYFAPEFGREHKRFMKEGGILHTGSLNPSMSKSPGRWHFDGKGRQVYSGDHSLTVRRAREGLEIAQSILKEMGARRITPIDVPIPINQATRGSHIVGSCRAGVDPKTSVVNPHFESHDVDNLFICDASVIPRVTTGNTGTPQAAVTVFGAARMVARHFSR